MPRGPEDDARDRIDEMLREAGWAVQDPDAHDTGVSERGIVLREYPFDSGAADDRSSWIGVFEANAEGTTLTDDAAATAEREHTRAERLQQSILKQAFSGRLVPHDEDATSPVLEPGSSDGMASLSSGEGAHSSGEDDVIAEELYNGGDPGKQIEMDL